MVVTEKKVVTNVSHLGHSVMVSRRKRQSPEKSKAARQASRDAAS